MEDEKNNISQESKLLLLLEGKRETEESPRRQRRKNKLLSLLREKPGESVPIEGSSPELLRESPHREIVPEEPLHDDTPRAPAPSEIPEEILIQAPHAGDVEIAVSSTEPVGVEEFFDEGPLMAPEQEIFDSEEAILAEQEDSVLSEALISDSELAIPVSLAAEADVETLISPSPESVIEAPPPNLQGTESPPLSVDSAADLLADETPFSSEPESGGMGVEPFSLFVSIKGNPTPGETLSYQIRYMNGSGHDLEETVIRHRFAPLLTYVPHSTEVNGVPVPDREGASPLTGEGLKLGYLGSGTEGRMSFKVRIQNAVTDEAVLINTTTLESRGDVLRENESQLVVFAQPHFSRSESYLEADGENDIRPHQILLLTVHVRNEGSATATHVTLLSGLPDNTTYIPNSTLVGGRRIMDIEDFSPLFSPAGLRLGTMAPGKKEEVSFALKVNRPLDQGTPISCKVVLQSDQTSPLDLVPKTFKVDSAPEFLDERSNYLRVAPQGAVEPRQTLQYTIFLMNHGNANAHQVAVRGRIPRSTRYVSGSTTLNGKPVQDRDGDCPLLQDGLKVGTIPIFSKVQISYQVTVASPLDNGILIENDSEIEVTGNRIHKLEKVRNIVKSSPNFSEAGLNYLTVSPDGEIEPENILTYTVRLVNTGNAKAGDVTVKALLPEFTSYVPESTTLDGKKVGDAKGTSPLFLSDGFHIGPVDADEGGEVTYRVKVNSPLDRGKIITNQVTIQTPELPPYVTNAVTNTVRSCADFGNRKTNLILVSPGRKVSPGERIVFTVQYNNHGHATARNAVVSGEFPEYLEYVPNQARLNSAPVADASGECPLFAKGGLAIGQVPAGQKGEIKVEARVRSPLEDKKRIFLKMLLASDQSEPVTLSSPTLEVRSIPSFSDFALTGLRVTPGGKVPSGELLTYVVSLQNSGTAMAKNVRILLSGPEATAYSLGTTTLNGAPADDQDGLSPLLSATGLAIGDLAPGQIVHGACKVRIKEGTPNGEILAARATLLCDELKPVLSNTTKNLVNSWVDFSYPAHITLDVDPQGSIRPGQTLKYQLTYRNGGNIPAHKVTLRARIPQHTSYVPHSTCLSGIPVKDVREECVLTREPGLVLPVVPPNEEGAISYEVLVKSPLENRVDIYNRATVQCMECEPVVTNTTHNIVHSAPDFADETRNFVEQIPLAGEQASCLVVINCMNTGNAPAYFVSARVDLPPSLSPVPGTLKVNGEAAAQDGIRSLLEKTGLNLGTIPVGVPHNISFEVSSMVPVTGVLPRPAVTLMSHQTAPIPLRFPREGETALSEGRVSTREGEEESAERRISPLWKNLRLRRQPSAFCAISS
ncbi:MAG: DUF11 domain-containing protein [Armatimonadetes bacterium]|nr:DUF11 domain-containing protein [Armatimonadota bacterium]